MARITKTLLGIFSILEIAGCGFPPPTDTSRSEPANVRFRGLPIEYKIASTFSKNARSEIIAAFESWNTATNTLVFKYDGIKDLKEDELAPDYTVNENVVLCTDQSGEMGGGADASGGTGPLARTYLKGSTKILDADIYLFSFNENYVSGRQGTGDIYSILEVVAHEAGHMLFGPEHDENPESIMTAVLYPIGHEKEKRGPAQVDVDRFFEVYGESL
jgi:hypothetical protein